MIEQAPTKERRDQHAVTRLEAQLQDLVKEVEEMGEDRQRVTSAREDLHVLRNLLSSRVHDLKREAIRLSHQERVLNEQRDRLETRQNEVNDRLRILVQREESLVEAEEQLAGRGKMLRDQVKQIEADRAEVARQQVALDSDRRIFQEQSKLHQEKAEALVKAREEADAQRKELLESEEHLRTTAEEIAERQRAVERGESELSNARERLRSDSDRAKAQAKEIEAARADLEQERTALRERQSVLDGMSETLGRHLDELSSRHAVITESEKSLREQDARLRERADQISATEERLSHARLDLQEQKDLLSSQEAELARQRESYEARHAELEEARGALTAAHEAEAAELKTRRDALADEQAEFRKTREAFVKQERELSSRLEDLEKQGRELSARLEEAERDKAAIARQADQIESEVARVQDLASKIEQERADLSLEAEELGAQRAAIENDRADLDRERAEIQQTRDELEPRQKALDQREARLAEQVVSLEAIQQELAAQREKLHAGVQAFDRKKQELQSRRDELEAEFEQRLAVVARHENEVAEARLAVDNLRAELGAEKEKLEAGAADLAQREEAIHGECRQRLAVAAEKETELRELESALVERETELIRAREELDVRQTELRQGGEGGGAGKKKGRPASASGRERAELEDLAESLKAERQSIVEERRGLERERESLQAEMQSLDEKTEARRVELDQLRAESTARLEKIERQRAELEQKMRELEFRCAEHAAEEERLEAERVRLEGESARIEKHRTDLDQTIETSRQELDRDRHAIEEERERIDRHATELADERAELDRMRLEFEVSGAGASADDPSRSNRWARASHPPGLSRRSQRRRTSLLAVVLAAGVFAWSFLSSPAEYAVDGVLAIQTAEDVQEAIARAKGVLEDEAILLSAGKRAGLSDASALLMHQRIVVDSTANGSEPRLIVRHISENRAAGQELVNARLAAAVEYINTAADNAVNFANPHEAALLEKKTRLAEEVAAAQQRADELFAGLPKSRPTEEKKKLDERIRRQQALRDELKKEYDAKSALVAELRQTADAPKGELSEEDVQLAEQADQHLRLDSEQLEMWLRVARDRITDAMDQSTDRFKPIFAALDRFERTLADEKSRETDLDAAGTLDRISLDLQNLRKSAETFEQDWLDAQERVAAMPLNARKVVVPDERDRLEKSLKDFQFDSNKKLGVIQKAMQEMGASASGSVGTARNVARTAIDRNIYDLLDAVRGFYVAASGLLLENNFKLKNAVEAVTGIAGRIRERKAWIRQRAQARADEKARSTYLERLAAAEAEVAALQKKRDAVFNEIEASQRRINDLLDEIVEMESASREFNEARKVLADREGQLEAVEQELRTYQARSGEQRVPDRATIAQAATAGSAPINQMKRTRESGIASGVSFVLVFLLGNLLVVGIRRPAEGSPGEAARDKAPLPAETAEPSAESEPAPEPFIIGEEETLTE